MIINIQHGFSHYSSEELLDKAHQGLLFCGDGCDTSTLSSLIDKLFDAEYAVEYEDGFKAGKREGQESCWQCGEQV